MLHNESVNVWSHLIGVGIFLGLLIWTACALSPISDYILLAKAKWSQEATDFESLCGKLLNLTLTDTVDMS